MFATGGVEGVEGVLWVAAQRPGAPEVVDGEMDDGRGEDRMRE